MSYDGELAVVPTGHYLVRALGDAYRVVAQVERGAQAVRERAAQGAGVDSGGEVLAAVEDEPGVAGVVPGRDGDVVGRDGGPAGTECAAPARCSDTVPTGRGPVGAGSVSRAVPAAARRSAAPVVVDREFTTSELTHNAIEPHATTAWWSARARSASPASRPRSPTPASTRRAAACATCR